MSFQTNPLRGGGSSGEDEETASLFAAATAWLESETGERIPLSGNCRLGRAPDNHVVILGQKTSRHHAAIHAQDDQEYWLIDMGSRNGTYRNDKRVLGPTRLFDVDRIGVGGEVFTFRQQTLDSADLTPAQQTSLMNGAATVVDFKQQDAWLLIADLENFTQVSQDWPAEKVAMGVGRWIAECRRLIERSGGRVAKYLGDGFLACWEASGGITSELTATLQGLHALQGTSALPFRVVLHHGSVTFGSAAQFGEESIIGSQLNFIFRLEKLASGLGIHFGVSEQAQALLAPLLATELLPGEYVLKGFEGTHRCYQIIWPE